MIRPARPTVAMVWLAVALIAAGGVVGATMASEAPATGSIEQPPAVQNATPTPTGNDTGTNTTGNQSLGMHLSSFMQSSAAQTNGSVETGMWVAAYENARSDRARAALLRRHTEELNTTAETLHERKRTLKAQRRNGTITRAEYRVRLSRIVGQLAALQAGIDETEQRAHGVGMNTTRLDAIRQRADRVAGGDVRAVARGLAGPNGTPPGAPAWRENRSDSRPAGGPPDRAASNRSAGQGPPDEPGHDGTGTATGNRTATDGGETGDGSGTGDADSADRADTMVVSDG